VQPRLETGYDVCVGLVSSDSYMKLAKQQELERQSRRNKKAVKQRATKSGRRRKHAAGPDDDHEEDIAMMHVVSTAVDAPEVLSVDGPTG